MSDKLKSLIRSRRFWVAVGGVIATALHEALGLTEDQTQTIVALLVTWIVGDSLNKTG